MAKTAKCWFLGQICKRHYWKHVFLEKIFSNRHLFILTLGTGTRSWYSHNLCVYIKREDRTILFLSKFGLTWSWKFWAVLNRFFVMNRSNTTYLWNVHRLLLLSICFKEEEKKGFQPHRPRIYLDLSTSESIINES